MAVTFTGFEPADFDLFSIPDFPGRMGEIRSRLRPKLLALGADLAERVSDLVEQPLFPHAAQHMRRRVNPPEESWAAFGRDKRGYKRWAHYRIAVSGAGVRVTVFVEDDADDKPVLAAALQSAAGEILRALGSAPVHWYTLDGAATGAPTGAATGRDVTPAVLAAVGERLGRLKLLKFQAGVPLPREAALRMTPEAFEHWALEQVALLRPLYHAASSAPSP